MSEQSEPQWMIVELMGHQKMAGQVSEVQVAGHGFLRIDVPACKGHDAYTRMVSPASVYALNPTTEEIATAAAANFRPRAVTRWELPQLTDGREDGGVDDGEIF